MSRKSDTAKLERTLAYIDDIELIVVKHGTIEETLRDLEGQYALTMCLFQIGELLGSVETEEFVQLLPVRLAKSLRNIVAHSYDAIDFSIIQSTIFSDIPALKQAIRALLG